MKKKIGIAISTYSEEKTNDERYKIIDNSLKSLQDLKVDSKFEPKLK